MASVVLLGGVCRRQWVLTGMFYTVPVQQPKDKGAKAGCSNEDNSRVERPRCGDSEVVGESV